MIGAGTVAAFTGDGYKCGIGVFVVGARNQVDASGVAEDTAAKNRVREVETFFRLIAGRYIPLARLRVIRSRRLEKIFPMRTM